MKFNNAAIILLAGSAAAAPLTGDKLSAREEHTAQLDKRITAWTAFGLGSLATWAAGEVVKAFKGGKRGVDTVASKALDEWTFEDAKEIFANGAVQELDNYADDSNAILCTDVDYTVETPANTKEFSSFTLESDGEKAKFDCFLIFAPNKVTINGEVTEASVAVSAGPGNWDSYQGVLTV